MDTDLIQRNWTEQKGRLIKRVTILTDNDLKFAEGKTENMLTKLRIQPGIT